jgi:glycosyltransferase involved in cell wall biosynthesis
MSKAPLVSVLMTAYNRAGYLSEAIRSVLASTVTDLELVVVDDGSTDDTVAVARDFARTDPRVRVEVNERNLGDYANRNRAAALARGRYLKYLDSDDVIYPHGLEVMTSAMEAFPEAGFGLSAMEDPAGPYPRCIEPRDIYLEHMRGFRHFDRSPGSSIIRRSVFEAAGGFSGRRMIGDMECWMRLARHHRLVKFPPGLMWTRSHGGRESQSGYALNYGRLRQEVFAEALAHPECPLSAAERAVFRRWLAGEERRARVRRWLSAFSRFR